MGISNEARDTNRTLQVDVPHGPLWQSPEDVCRTTGVDLLLDRVGVFLETSQSTPNTPQNGRHTGGIGSHNNHTCHDTATHSRPVNPLNKVL